MASLWLLTRLRARARAFSHLELTNCDVTIFISRRGSAMVDERSSSLVYAPGAERGGGPSDARTPHTAHRRTQRTRLSTSHRQPQYARPYPRPQIPKAPAALPLVRLQRRPRRPCRASRTCAPAHLSPALIPSSLYPMLVSTSMTADSPRQPDPPGSRPLVNQPALSPACQPANLPTNQQPARKPQANHSHDATRYNTSSTSTSTTHRPSSTRHDTIRCARAQIRSKIARPARSLSFLQVSPTLTLGRNTLESGQRTVCRRRHARPRRAASRFQLSTRHRPARKPLARPPIDPSPRGSKPRT